MVELVQTPEKFPRVKMGTHIEEQIHLKSGCCTGHMKDY